MKLIIIDLEGSTIKGMEFANNVKDILECEVILLEPYKIDSKNEYTYGKFSKAAFALEEYILKSPNYWTNNMPFINAMYVWGNYCLNNISSLKEFKSINLPNLLVFPSYNQKGAIWNPSWVFGNIVAMLKWSTSVFKLDKSVTDNLAPIELTFFNLNGVMSLPLWYATRINLDVRFIYNDTDLK